MTSDRNATTKPSETAQTAAAGDDSARATYSNAYVLYAIGVVLLVSAFNTMDRFILSVLAPTMQQDLSLSDAEMGLLLGPSFSIVHFLAVIPAAWLADRYARRTVVALGLFVWSGMTVLGAAATGFWPLFMTRMGVGIGEAAGSPPSAGLLSDTAPAVWRTRALSSLTVGALVGLAVGMIAGGAIGEAYGWRTALVALGLPGVAVAVLVRFTLREPPRSGGVGVSPQAAAGHLFGIPSFRWALAGACVANIAIAGRALWEPSFLARAYDLTGASLGTTYVLANAVPTMAGAFTGAAIADRLSVRDPRWLVWVCAGSLVASTPLLLAFYAWDPADRFALADAGIPVSFCFLVPGSFVLGFFSAPMASLAQLLATPNMRSLAHAIWTMPFTLVGMGAGPMVIGTLSGLWGDGSSPAGLRDALAVSCLALPIGAIGLFLAARSLREDAARVAAQP